MSITEQILTLEHETEHNQEHDLILKRTYSDPKIYIASGDLSKRWYVYFSFRNPDTGKLERMKNIYSVTNSYKTKEQRMRVLSAYRRNLLKLLKQGYSPFEDNSFLVAQEKSNNVSQNVTNIKIGKQTSISNQDAIKGNIKSTASLKEESSKSILEEPTQKENKINNVQVKTIKESFEFALALKEKVISISTKRSYQNRVKNFLEWLDKSHKEVTTIDQLDKKVVNDFLNEVLLKTSARNRNNYRTELSSLLQTIEDNDLIAYNFIKKIPVLKTKSERNKTYSKELNEKIFSCLEEKDPILLLYIKFISYSFLRPIEVSRLKIKDINLISRTIQFKAKNSPLKTKIIPDILLKELPDITKLNKEDYVFTPNAIGGKWEAALENRRGYFSNRFRETVKKHFKLGNDFGLYSFRHTFITKLYRQMVKDSSPFEAKSRLMLITGHSSMSALEKYLRDIDAELPADFSHLLK